jgi:dihydroflavonol-4-reductase
MSTPNEQLVLVTGVSGYIGLHCAAELLNKGYKVRGTVRSLGKEAMVKTAVARASSRADELELVEADLLKDAGWSAAVEGCDFVLHVASPFIMSEPDDPNELIRPAVEGTKRVLKHAKRAGVKRLILTSSIVAMFSDKVSGTGTPDDWADPDQVGSYAKSKILAEQAAWRFIAAQTGSDAMEMVAINPGGVMGPTLTGVAAGASTTMISDMINGKLPMIPDLNVGMVDVRDVALAHVAALTVAEAAGKRFVVAAVEPVAMMHVAKTLKSAGYPKVSTRKAPTFLLRMMAPFNKDVKGMVSFVGRKVRCDNSKTRELLNWTPRPIEKSLLEMAESLSG